MKHYWFKARSYGWGWYPSAWQGWLVLFVFLVLDVGNAYRLDSMKGVSQERIAIELILETLLLVGVLVLICYRMGEKPSWRWGNKNKK
jgi:hypothetical protein